MDNAKALISKNDSKGLIALLDKYLADGSAGNDSKSVINYIAKNIGSLKSKDALPVCEHAVQKIKGLERQLLFDEEVSTIRYLLI